MFVPPPAVGRLSNPGYPQPGRSPNVRYGNGWRQDAAGSWITTRRGPSVALRTVPKSSASAARFGTDVTFRHLSGFILDPSPYLDCRGIVPAPRTNRHRPGGLFLTELGPRPFTAGDGVRIRG